MNISVVEFHEMLCVCGEDESPWDHEPIQWYAPNQNWSDLMHVVEKIEDLGFTYRIENRIDKSKWMWVWEDEDDNPIVSNCSKTIIECVYKTVTDFISWYNLHNPSTL